jgi:type IV pilus assembly protein PilV
MPLMKPRQHLRPHAARRCRGVSLIEVLVVIVLFSFGLIGMVGLQAKAVQNSVSAEDSARAALMANEIVSTMWANSTVSLPTATVTAWNSRVADTTAGGVPNGAGTVTVASGVATVTVTWRAPHEPSGTSHNYTTQVQMP